MRTLGVGLAAGAVLLLAGCSAAPDPHARAWAALQAGDHVMAERLYLDLLTANASDPFALLNLAVTYQNGGRPDLAATHYRRLIALDPPDTTPLSADGRAEVRLVDLARENLGRLP